MMWPAFVLGLFGSVHCAVMCSPIMASIQWRGVTSLNVLFKKLSYQAGRIFTYVVIGILFYSVGHLFMLATLQRSISQVVGVLLMLYSLSRLFSLFKSNGLIGWWYSQAGRVFKPLLGSKSMISRFFLGALNGLLPCGMVYVAAFTSVTMSSIGDVVLYMIFFGLGTLPLIWIVLQSIGKIKKTRLFSFNRIAPYFLLFLGVFFLLRGMELGIPYVSPVLSPEAGSVICEP